MRAEPGRLALGLGTGLVTAIALIALLAPWLAPYDPREQIDPAAGARLPPGSERWVITDGARSRLAEALETRDGVTGYLRLGTWHPMPRSDADSPVARRYALGTDRYGRDLASRVLWGARVSLRVGSLAVAVSLLLGILCGAAAGLARPWLDGVLMRGVDGLMAFPRLFLVLAASALWRADETLVILLLGATGWMEIARLVRAEVRSLRTRDFVLAARATGVTRTRLLARHLLPAALPPVLVIAALRVGDTILAEAALSFLGFGVQPPTPSWGNLIADAQETLESAWWAAAFPGAAIVATVLGFGLLADGLRDRLDPSEPDA